MDLTGEKFGRLTLIKRISAKWGNEYECVCECGNKIIARSNNLKRGHTKSCGCFREDFIRNVSINNVTHHKSRTKEYKAWVSMKSRCCDENYHGYHRYGGRGIKVCNEWLNDFKAFFDHVGEAPSEEHSIDRIDNDGDYKPGNVKWSLPIEFTFLIVPSLR